MTSSSSSIEVDDLARFKRHARSGLVMTMVGAAIVVSALVYSGRALVSLQTERNALQAQLAEANRDLAKANLDLDMVRKSGAAAKEELDQIERGVKAARSSFIFVQLGIRQFSLRDYAGSIQFYDQALATDPNNPIVYDLRGYALLKSGNVQRAIASLEKSISLAPDYVWGHYNLALAYGKNGQTAQAIQQITLLLQLDPSMKETLRDDGQFRIFRNLREYQELVGRG